MRTQDEEKPRHSLPVSKPPASRYGNNRFIFYSPTLGRRLILGSGIEWDACVEIEATHKKHYCEQPRRVQVLLRDGLVRTVFDFWIHWPDGSEEYREVKLTSDLVPGSRALVQIEAQKTFCRLHGFKHTVATEKTIRANPLYLDNWKRILTHLGMTSTIDLRPITKRLVRLLRTVRRCRMSTLESALAAFDPVLVRAAMYTLIHRREATADLKNEVLGPSLYLEVVE